MTSKFRLFRPHRSAKTLLLGKTPQKSMPGFRLAGAGLAIFAAVGALFLSDVNNFQELSSETKNHDSNPRSNDCTVPASENKQSEFIQIGGIRAYRARSEFAECDAELIVLESLDSKNLWKKIGATEVTPID